MTIRPAGFSMVELRRWMPSRSVAESKFITQYDQCSPPRSFRETCSFDKMYNYLAEMIPSELECNGPPENHHGHLRFSH